MTNTDEQPLPQGSKHHRQTAQSAVFWMIVAALLFSLVPLMIWVGTRDTSPLLFVVFMFGGSVFGQLLLAQAQSRHWPSRGHLAMAKEIAAVKPKYLLAVVLFRFGYVLYPLAVVLTDPLIPSVISSSLWPVVFVLATSTGIWRSRMLSATSSARKPMASLVALMSLGAVGIALVVISESGLVGLSGSAALGALLGLGSAITVGLGEPFIYLSAVDQRPGYNLDQSAVSSSVFFAAEGMVAVCLVFVSLIATWIGWMDWKLALGGVLIALLIGVVRSLAEWFFVYANHVSRRIHQQTGAKINSIFYIQTALALLLLVIFADSSIDYPLLLALGSVCVIAANIILHVKHRHFAWRRFHKHK